MKTTRLSRLGPTTLLLAVLLLAACDDADPGADATPTAVVTATTPPTASPQASPESTPNATPVATPSPTGAPVASTASIPTEDLPLVRFVAHDGAEATLPIEAPPSDEYSIGLSGRHELEGRGMLFYYPSGDRTGGFWMRGTFIDLDIAFVSADLEVIDILRMEAETEEIHRPGSAYLAAIEAPAGWFDEHRIGPGARVEFLFDVEEHLR